MLDLISCLGLVEDPGSTGDPGASRARLDSPVKPGNDDFGVVSCRSNNISRKVPFTLFQVRGSKRPEAMLSGMSLLYFY